MNCFGFISICDNNKQIINKQIAICMNYIKSLAKSVYENVVQDEYLEMLTEQQIYFIINTTHRKRLFSHGQDNSKLNESQTNQSLM